MARTCIPRFRTSVERKVSHVYGSLSLPAAIWPGKHCHSNGISNRDFDDKDWKFVINRKNAWYLQMEVMNDLVTHGLPVEKEYTCRDIGIIQQTLYPEYQIKIIRDKDHSLEFFRSPNVAQSGTKIIYVFVHGSYAFLVVSIKGFLHHLTFCDCDVGGKGFHRDERKRHFSSDGGSCHET